MVDSNWDSETVDTVRKYAMQNTVEYDGAGQPGSVLGRLLGERSDLRPRAKELKSLVEKEVEAANKMAKENGINAVRDSLAATNPEALERQKQQKRVGLKPLPNAIEGKVILRFAPNPNGPLTIGHSRGVVINSEFAKMYSGKVVLRYDDTDTRVKPPLPEAYGWIEEEYEWLAGRPADIVIRASERMPIYLEYAKQMLESGFGYICQCTALEFKTLRDNSQSCVCRGKTVEDNLSDWRAMNDGSIEEGGAVVRVKTDLELPNPALRDWPALRIQHSPHPMVGDSYKVWPLLDFQSAIEDYLQGVTHIVRGKDLMDSTRKQTLLYNHFGWDYPEPLYWGRVKVHEFGGFSTSGMRADIADGKFEGWNDPRLPTISALKRRGFDPQAIRDFWLDLGLTQKDISISMQTIESFNSSVIDAVCERRSFVRNPRALSFNMIGSELPEKLQIARHPHDEIEGFREWKISDKFVIEDTDYSEQLRLKDFADISINHNDALVDSLERSDKRPIVHWLPINQSRMARLTSPSGSGFRVEEGLIENFELVEGTIVQLERVGFARIEKIPENGPVDLLYLHG
ncbi:MAG: glutamate--tRNA ligase [Candidatus Thalassarchaeum sp.]|nr:glutamate--tRNA ligase [Candidatus Thalassarchaeum sp.]